MIDREFEAVHAGELLAHPHDLDAAHERRHTLHHVHLHVAVDEEVATQAHLLSGFDVRTVAVTGAVLVLVRARPVAVVVRMGSVVVRVRSVRMGFGPVTL